MRTGTGILTRSDVMALTNATIWSADTTRCVTVASLANTLSPFGIEVRFNTDSTRGNLASDSYRLVPVDMVTFSTTPTGLTTYKFNVFGDTSSTSSMNSFTFNGALIIQQGTSAPAQNFDIRGDIYKKGKSVDFSYQGSTISETVFNQLRFYITGGWTPNYSCTCKIFKTKGTSFNDASIDKDPTPIYQMTSAAKNISTYSNQCLLSSIGTYDEFKRGLLGIYILLERSETGGTALTISPTNWYPTYSASSKTFTAYGLSGNLSVLNKPTWASVNISGSTVTVSITKNTTTNIRSGTVILSGKGTDGFIYNPSIAISQAAGSPPPSLFPTTKTVTSDAQTIDVKFSNVSSISTESTTNSSIANPVHAASNIFNRQIIISANNTTSARGATITYTVIDLDGATKSLTVTITQNGKTSTASPIISVDGGAEWTQITSPINGYNVYKSNTISDNSWTILTLNIDKCKDLSPLDIYIRSYAEGNYDYAVAYELDFYPEPSTYRDITDTATGAIANTKGNQQSGTGLASYTKVSYTIPDNGVHNICVAYRKDINGKDGDDAAYVAVPNKYIP